MAAVDDLKSAYVALQAELEAAKTYLGTIPDLLAAAQTATDAELETLKAQVQTDTAALQAATAAAPK